jgi:hypothetical protein
VNTPATADGTAVAAPDRDGDGIPDFILPEDGPEPDGSEPEAARLFAEKRQIHQYMRELDDIYSKAHPGRDFKAEYAADLAEMEKSKAERPGQGAAHGISRGLAKLASFNPASRDAFEEFEGRTAEEQSAHDKAFSQRMLLRQKMHEGAASEAEAKGNWKAALKERETLALMKSDEDALKHKRDMEKTRELVKGRADVATIKANQMRDTATARARGAATGLNEKWKAYFMKKVAENLAQFAGPQSLMKDYTQQDLDSLIDQFEHMSDTFAELQANGQLPPGEKAAETPKPKRERF